MFTYTKKAQSGRSMIEMLGVLAIVGVLSAGGITGYSMAMQTHKTNTLIERVNLVATRARSLYKGTYTDISANNLKNSGKVTEGDIVDPFGGSLTVASTTASEFTIATSANVPAEACTDLLTADWGNSGVFKQVQVTGKSARTTTPVATGTAITDCSGGGKAITFTFK